MASLARDLGCIAVGVDCETDHQPASLNFIIKHVTAKTKAIVVAPLFGGRVDLAAHRRFCDAHRIILIEDAAQGYSGDGWPQQGRAHDTLCSFGLLKRATCLRGGVLLICSHDEQKTLLHLQKKYIKASSVSSVRLWLIAVLGKACTLHAATYGLPDRILRMFRRRLTAELLALMRSKRQM